MKYFFNSVYLIVFMIVIGLTTSYCTKDDVATDQDSGYINLSNLYYQINDSPMEALSQGEINSLVYMREEEKLARDVYGTLYQRWKSNIFNNISSSEQTHMDAILHLLQRYNLPDPVASNEVGVFSNTILQDLYNQLVIKGNSSLSNAFQVGATIEDLDIFDLTQAMILVDNQDISLVYSMLTKGSRNHLRSFYRNILNVGGSYTPIYITQEEFETVIQGNMETGF